MRQLWNLVALMNSGSAMTQFLLINSESHMSIANQFRERFCITSDPIIADEFKVPCVICKPVFVDDFVLPATLSLLMNFESHVLVVNQFC